MRGEWTERHDYTEEVLIDLDRRLRTEAGRIRSQVGGDTERLEQLATHLIERILLDKERAAEVRVRSVLMILQRVLEPICGTRAAAELLATALEAKPHAVIGQMAAVRARASLVYGLKVAQIIEAVSMKLQWHVA